MDEHDVASLWRTEMTESQLCKANMELHMHVLNEIAERQSQRD